MWELSKLRAWTFKMQYSTFPLGIPGIKLKAYWTHWWVRNCAGNLHNSVQWYSWYAGLRSQFERVSRICKWDWITSGKKTNSWACDLNFAANNGINLKCYLLLQHGSWWCLLTDQTSCIAGTGAPFIFLSMCRITDLTSTTYVLL